MPSSSTKPPSVSHDVMYISKTGEIKISPIRNLQIDELYKKCGHRQPDGFKYQCSWSVENTIIISLYGKTEQGRITTQNEYVFPHGVPFSKIYGTCVVVATTGNTATTTTCNMTESLWSHVLNTTQQHHLSPAPEKTRAKPGSICGGGSGSKNIRKDDDVKVSAATNNGSGVDDKLIEEEEEEEEEDVADADVIEDDENIMEEDQDEYDIVRDDDEDGCDDDDGGADDDERSIPDKNAPVVYAHNDDEDELEDELAVSAQDIELLKTGELTYDMFVSPPLDDDDDMQQLSMYIHFPVAA